MFKLDQAIIEWRRQMLAAGIRSPVPLEKLESHLREDIERLRRSGLNLQQAFERSVERIGEAKMLKTEFAKAGGTGETRWRKAVLAAAITNILLGALWIFAGLHSLHSAYRILRLRVQFDPGDVQHLAFSYSITFYGAICGFVAIVAAIRLFKRRRSGLTLTATCAVLTILGVFVDFFWRLSQTGFRSHLGLMLLILLSYPMILLALCQKSELKEQYV